MDALESYTPQISVLGAIMLQPELMGEAMLSLTGDDFQTPACRVCWQAMTRLFRSGQSVDVVLLRDALSGMDNFSGFVSACMEAAPVAGSFPAHVQALKRQSMTARLRDIGQSLSVCTDPEEALSLVGKANEISIQRAARERRSMSGMLRSFGDRHAGTVKPDYLPWPLKPLNDGIRVHGGKFVVIGGYPSDGKTAFALQCSLYQAQRGARCAFYSFETDADTAEDRMIASAAQISMDAIQHNRLTDDDWTRYGEAAALSEYPFDVVSASGMTVDDIRADALAHRYTVIYIDYLQLISPARRNSNFSRFDEVSEISRGLQQLAKTTGITVVALSQMSRPAPDKQGKIPPPTMHNLRESGQIEQDADVIMLIYRMDHKDIRAPRYLDVAKNKEGRTGHWPMYFDGGKQTFFLSAKQPEESGMPRPVRNHRPTPVIGTAVQEQFPLINGPDDRCPF